MIFLLLFLKPVLDIEIGNNQNTTQLYEELPMLKVKVKIYSDFPLFSLYINKVLYPIEMVSLY